MLKLDCLGEICPIPILRLQKAEPEIREGESLLMITDHSCTVPSVREFCRRNHLLFASEEVMNGVWEITISRSCPA